MDVKAFSVADVYVADLATALLRMIHNKNNWRFQEVVNEAMTLSVTHLHRGWCGMRPTQVNVTMVVRAVERSDAQQSFR